MYKATINKQFQLKGVGLHSGRPVNISFKPSSEGSGIVFIRTDLNGGKRIKACLNNVTSTVRGTNLGDIFTVEHVLSALYCMGITDVEIEIDSPEPPAFDGSSWPIVEALKNAGKASYSQKSNIVGVKGPMIIRSEEKAIFAFPSDRFKIDFMINYRFPFIGAQYFRYEFGQRSYEEQIALARTYGFVSELETLKTKGLGLGASIDNAIAISDTGYVNELRYPNELVRHKILDLIGDLSLTGCEIKAHIICIGSGHAMNIELANGLVSI